MNLCDEGIFMQISQGSASNLKPELVMKSLAEFTKTDIPEYLLLERLDMYCMENDRLVSLDDIGGCIE